MSSISVKKLDERAYELLRIRAACHGVSMEEEVRQIIYQVVSAPESVSKVFQKHFGIKNGIDLPQQVRKPHEPLDFD